MKCSVPPINVDRLGSATKLCVPGCRSPSASCSHLKGSRRAEPPVRGCDKLRGLSLPLFVLSNLPCVCQVLLLSVLPGERPDGGGLEQMWLPIWTHVLSTNAGPCLIGTYVNVSEHWATTFGW